MITVLFQGDSGFHARNARKVADRKNVCVTVPTSLQAVKRTCTAYRGGALATPSSALVRYQDEEMGQIWDCRFGILVKNYTRKVTSDISDVSDVTDVTDVSDVTNGTLRKLV